MYANLKVHIRRGHDEQSDETLYAYRVSILNSTATVFLDSPDPAVPEPAGERVIDMCTHGMTIEADF